MSERRIDLIATQILHEIIAEEGAGSESRPRRIMSAKIVVEQYRKLRADGMPKQKKPRKYRRIARRLGRRAA